MSVATTWTPSPCRREQIAAPMPLAAPVTSALFPRSPLSGIGGAVDVYSHPGHVRGVVGAERDDQRRGLRHRADPSHGDLREWPFGAFVFSTDGKHLLQTTTRNHARRDTIHPHAELAELERELARERHHAGLRDGIGAA